MANFPLRLIGIRTCSVFPGLYIRVQLAHLEAFLKICILASPGLSFVENENNMRWDSKKTPFFQITVKNPEKSSGKRY